MCYVVCNLSRVSTVTFGDVVKCSMVCNHNLLSYRVKKAESRVVVDTLVFLQSE